MGRVDESTRLSIQPRWGTLTRFADEETADPELMEASVVLPDRSASSVLDTGGAGRTTPARQRQRRPAAIAPRRVLVLGTSIAACIVLFGGWLPGALDPAGGASTALPVLSSARQLTARRPAARAEDGAAPVTPTPDAPGASDRRCPWATPQGERGKSPQQLAAEVLAQMNLADKLDLVIIRYHGAYENELSGIPSLCIPPLTMQDGAAGISYHMKHVTQLPAPLGVAASFDTSLAEQYGRVVAEEDRGKGIDVFQGPSLSLVRVPESGRAFENFGEDPELASALGVAEIEGVQSEGIVAEATHLAAYTQETDRTSLDQHVSTRALQEVYLAPFRAAVEQAHVGSLMCAYGTIDGVRDCQDGALFGDLAAWRFDGFVRSDLDAVHNSVAAFDAGVDAIKPASVHELLALVDAHELPERRLDAADLHVLETMFRFGLIEHPIAEAPEAHVDSAAHAAFALRAAEESMVLLKNRDSLLPLSSRTSSIALIGTDAGPEAMTAGQGSAHVLAPFVSTPLSAITSRLGRHRSLRDVAGSSPVAALPAIPLGEVRSRRVDLIASLLLDALHSKRARLTDAPRGAPARAAAVRVIDDLVLSGATGTGSIPPQDFAELDRLEMTVVPPASGLYAISVSDRGDAWLNLNGKLLFADSGEHVWSTWQVTAELTGGRPARLSLFWFPVLDGRDPTLGLQDETPFIERAVVAARSARVAIVFLEAPSSEGVDRPDLLLPGAQDALVSAVSAANPRTVVVLNTPGAVLMPWLSRVRAVLEAWYPGEEDGSATAAVLFGSVDPSGRLPVTFPAGGGGVPGGEMADWPGVDGIVEFAGDLDIGYRYDAAEHLTPLFPFGFGLSYTSFRLGALTLRRFVSGETASVRVTDTGGRSGAEVVEAYLSFPSSAGEPPIQLVAFERVGLLGGQSKTVELQVPDGAFQADLEGRFIAVPGSYTLRVGTSSADLPLNASLAAP